MIRVPPFATRSTYFPLMISRIMRIESSFCPCSSIITSASSNTKILRKRAKYKRIEIRHVKVPISQHASPQGGTPSQEPHFIWSTGSTGAAARRLAIQFFSLPCVPMTT